MSRARFHALTQSANVRFAKLLVCALAFGCAALSAGAGIRQAMADAPPPPPALCGWTVQHKYEHDPGAFTQGLQLHDGVLIEGTGLYGESTLRKVELASGKVLESLALERRFFGEGITVFKDRVFQLTWREQTAIEYRIDDFTEVNRYSYPGEGWGLTHNDNSLIMSDGTAEIRFLDPDSFAERSRITVRTDRGPVTQINELEYVNGVLFANVWQTAFILRIDPANGAVTGVLDMRKLLDIRPAPGVLNGIAHIPGTQRLLVTGKNWPSLFEITPDCP